MLVGDSTDIFLLVGLAVEVVLAEESHLNTNPVKLGSMAKGQFLLEHFP